MVTLCDSGFAVLPGHEQKPGQVPADVIDELKAKIRDMPEKKKYTGKSVVEEVKKKKNKKEKKDKKKVEAVSETDTAAALG